jgi:hypothetical protein
VAESKHRIKIMACDAMPPGAVLLTSALIEVVEFEGETHMIDPLGGAEHTLCGVAFDAADSEGDEALRWKLATERLVSCADCSRVIRACQTMPTTGPRT